MSDFSQHPDREDEHFDMSISQVWIQERISCPHRDILRAYLAGGIKKREQDYVQFHLETIKCPYCLANVEDLEAASRTEKKDLHRKVTRARSRGLDSSAVFLQKLRDSRAGDA